MLFKSFINESEDIEVLRNQSIKKLEWLLKKLDTTPKLETMADSIIFDLRKLKVGFTYVEDETKTGIKKNIVNGIYFLKKLKDENMIREVAKNIRYFIKGDFQ